MKVLLLLVLLTIFSTASADDCTENYFDAVGTECKCNGNNCASEKFCWESDYGVLCHDEAAVCKDHLPNKDVPVNCKEYVGVVGCDHKFKGNKKHLELLCCETCKSSPNAKCDDHWSFIQKSAGDAVEGMNNCYDVAKKNGLCSAVPDPDPFGIKPQDMCCKTCKGLPEDTTCIGTQGVDYDICAASKIYFGTGKCDGKAAGVQYVPITFGVCKSGNNDDWQKVSCNGDQVTMQRYTDKSCTTEGASLSWKAGECFVLDPNDDAKRAVSQTWPTTSECTNAVKGCDDVAGSGKVTDACGVCGGSGATCAVYSSDNGAAGLTTFFAAMFAVFITLA